MIVKPLATAARLCRFVLSRTKAVARRLTWRGIATDPRTESNQIARGPQSRILMVGSAPNLGDAAIGIAMIQDLQSVLPDAEIRYLGSNIRILQTLPELRNINVQPVSRIAPRVVPAPLWLEPILAAPRWLLLIGWWLSIRFTGGRFLLPGHIARYLQDQIGWADCVVFQGGPYWNDDLLPRLSFSPQDVLRKLAQRLMFMAAIRHYRKPLVLYAQSFGPFAWRGLTGVIQRWILRRHLNYAHLITTRDRFSRKYLARLNVDRPAIVDATDAAIRLRTAPAQRGRGILDEFGVHIAHRPLIGLTVRSFQCDYGFSAQEHDRQRRELAQFLDQVLESIGDIVFLSTDYTQHHDRPNDLETMRLVQALMKKGDQVHVIDRPLPPSEIKAVYGLCSWLITVRLHPAILALGQGVPTLLIGYNQKCHDYMKQMGLADYCIAIDRFTSANGFKVVKELAANVAELRHHVHQRVQQLQQEALVSATETVALVQSNKPFASGIKTKAA